MLGVRLARTVSIRPSKAFCTSAAAVGTHFIDTDRPLATIGCGTIEHSMALSFALAGYTVRCFDPHAEARESLHERCRVHLDSMVAGGLLDGAAVGDCLSRLVTCDSEREALADAALVSEAQLFESQCLRRRSGHASCAPRNVCAARGVPHRLHPAL